MTKHLLLSGFAALVLAASIGLVHELGTPPAAIATKQQAPPTTTPHIAIAGALDQPIEPLPEALVPRTPITVTPLATQPERPPSYPDTTPAPELRSK